MKPLGPAHTKRIIMTNSLMHQCEMSRYVSDYHSAEFSILHESHRNVKFLHNVIPVTFFRPSCTDAISLQAYG
jgi:hypothetical protein